MLNLRAKHDRSRYFSTPWRRYPLAVDAGRHEHDVARPGLLGRPLDRAKRMRLVSCGVVASHRGYVKRRAGRWSPWKTGNGHGERGETRNPQEAAGRRPPRSQTNAFHDLNHQSLSPAQR